MGRGNSKAGGGFSTSLVQDTLYHGTNAPNITTFNTFGKESSGAIFFADDIDYAEEEANIKSAKNGSATMYEVKLNIQKPLEVTLSGSDFADNHVEKRYIDQAKKQGYDSVIFHSDFGDPLLDQSFYAVFSPKQVKIVKKSSV